MHRNEYEATVQHAHTLQSVKNHSDALKISANDIETQHLYTRVRLSISEVTRRLKENLDVAIAKGDEVSVSTLKPFGFTHVVLSFKYVNRFCVSQSCSQR